MKNLGWSQQQWSMWHHVRSLDNIWLELGWPGGYQLALFTCLVAWWVQWKAQLSYDYPLKCLCVVFLSRFSSVQSLNRVQLFATPWTTARQASQSITNSQSPPKSMSLKSVMPSNHLILCHRLLPPSIFPNIRVFSKKSAVCVRWPKCWCFTFSISPSNESSGRISFKNWLVWFPCSPRDSQESSPTPQFKSINSLALSFLHSPTLTSRLDHWKNHSLDKTDLCWQSNVSAL